MSFSTLLLARDQHLTTHSSAQERLLLASLTSTEGPAPADLPTLSSLWKF